MQDDRPTILIADDDPEILSLLVDVLEPDGYRLLVAHDAESTLQLAQAHDPDLYLLDVAMPGSDGFEIVQQLKAQQPERQFPVVFLTALDQPAQVQQAFALGALDYLTKPFSIAVLRARVHTWLQRLGKLHHDDGSGGSSATVPTSPAGPAVV